MQPRIRGIQGPLKETNFPLFDGEVSIGRDPANQLWAADAGLSRRHCLLTGEGGRFSIRDLGSRNGTLVQGVPIEEHQLLPGEQISVGHSLLVFLLEEEKAALGRSPVELSETGSLGLDPILLRAQDAVYLQGGTMPLDTVNANRQAQDLKCLLTIATGIGQIHDRESLEWQLLGMIFDVVPADRAAILHFGADVNELESAVAWDRNRGAGSTGSGEPHDRQSRARGSDRTGGHRCALRHELREGRDSGATRGPVSSLCAIAGRGRGVDGHLSRQPNRELRQNSSATGHGGGRPGQPGAREPAPLG